MCQGAESRKELVCRGMVDPYTRGTGDDDDLHVRWSNATADPDVTSGELAYRQGRDRPCAGLRSPRTANRASGRSSRFRAGSCRPSWPVWWTPESGHRSVRIQALFSSFAPARDQVASA